MTLNYNTMPATLHCDDGSHVRGTIHDTTPGKHGYTGFIHNDGEFEFVEDSSLTFNTDNYADCLTCKYADD
jgi:hypothetical protein